MTTNRSADSDPNTLGYRSQLRKPTTATSDSVVVSVNTTELLRTKGNCSVPGPSVRWLSQNHFSISVSVLWFRYKRILIVFFRSVLGFSSMQPYGMTETLKLGFAQLASSKSPSPRKWCSALMEFTNSVEMKLSVHTACVTLWRNDTYKYRLMFASRQQINLSQISKNLNYEPCHWVSWVV